MSKENQCSECQVENLTLNEKGVCSKCATPVRKKWSQGKKNRNSGHQGERHYAALFRDLGFEHCKTSRAASRLMDDSKIDLCFTDPLNIQIKVGKQRGLIVSKELSMMKEETTKNFPKDYPIHENIKMLIHRKDIGRGRRRNEFDEIVSMTLKDFIKLFKLTGI